MMDGPAVPVDFTDLEHPGEGDIAGSDKAGSSTLNFAQKTSHIFFESTKEKEMGQFIASVLGKTSKLHQLIGELQSKYDDARAVKFLGVSWQRMTSHDNSCKQLTTSKFLAGRKNCLKSAVQTWSKSMTSWCSSRPKVN